MRKIIIFVLLVCLAVGVFIKPAISAQVYLDQVNMGIDTIFKDGRNYIAVKDAALLLKQEEPMGDPNFLLAFKDIANHVNYYVQWDITEFI